MPVPKTGRASIRAVTAATAAGLFTSSSQKASSSWKKVISIKIAWARRKPPKLPFMSRPRPARRLRKSSGSWARMKAVVWG